MNKTIYLAGPITGVPNYWEPFEKAEDELEAAGFTVLSPTRLNHKLSNPQAMRICMSMIDTADAVVFLPGWENSKGAQLELTYCQYMDKPTYFSVLCAVQLLKEVET